jgi:predicted nuclease of predicted toxin-antitoxin system
VKFLVDANLPPVLAQWLTIAGHDAQHVSELDMTTATDVAIWARAREMNACIVTKDEDFVLLHAIESSGPPVVWVRIGNATRRTLLARLPAIWPAVVAALRGGERIVEVR